MSEVLTWNTACAVIAVSAFALNLWAFLRRRRERRELLSLEEPNSYREHWTERVAFQAFRQLLRAKLLAGGYGKHHAYYIAGDGRVLVADAVDFYLALFAGVEDFWHVVACAERHQRGTHLLAAPLKEIDFGDGERGYTRVHYCGGETYIDIGPVGDLSYPHRCTWATADEFKQAVVDAQAKASECGKGNDGVSGDFHGREV